MIDDSISFLSFAFSHMSSRAFLGDIKRECPRGSWPNLIHPGKEKKQSLKEREGRRIAVWWWCSGSARLCNILCRVFPEPLQILYYDACYIWWWNLAICSDSIGFGSYSESQKYKTCLKALWKHVISVAGNTLIQSIQSIQSM